ncbi:ABC-type transport auxiliary lipoprotein family protein [Ciceribacter naphthalenivorans]|uniref:ABC-type transport auxiliary lipoprotein family protein n=1 Tax=Ciceribacter naphthalenivorans TaxID=1118451 RepID=UPI0011BFA4FF|nr:ABC-type transport auxiliary lipoprotein family protein [Ciceribacter naphthalenivorans]
MEASAITTRRKTGWRSVLVLPLLLAGLAACGSKAPNDTFDITAAPAVKTNTPARSRQLLVADPTALKALDSEMVLVRVTPSEVRYLSKSQWSDKLTRMVQAKLVETFENTGKLDGVGKPGQGLAIDFQLISDIRAFEVDTVGADRGVVEISVKLLNDRNGSVKAQKVFSASELASGTSNEAYIRAMDRAFARVSAEIVAWTLAQL